MSVPFQEDVYDEIISVGQTAASFIREHFENKDFKEVSLNINGKKVLRFADAYGFRNI